MTINYTSRRTSVILEKFNFINVYNFLFAIAITLVTSLDRVNVITYSINQHAYGRCLRAARYVDTYVTSMKKFRT